MIFQVLCKSCVDCGDVSECFISGANTSCDRCVRLHARCAVDTVDDKVPDLPAKRRRAAAKKSKGPIPKNDRPKNDRPVTRAVSKWARSSRSPSISDEIIVSASSGSTPGSSAGPSSSKRRTRGLGVLDRHLASVARGLQESRTIINQIAKRQNEIDALQLQLMHLTRMTQETLLDQVMSCNV
jgi:hypothetical protein